MNTEVSLPMASDAPNDDIAGVPQFAVLRDADEAPAVPSVIEPTPDTMAVQTSVSPVLNMDDLQMVFTTSNNPRHWITFSRVTPAAVVGKLLSNLLRQLPKSPQKRRLRPRLIILTLR